MDLINVNDNESLLAVCESGTEPQLVESLRNITNKIVVTPQNTSGLKEGAFDAVLLQLGDEKITELLLRQVLKYLKPGARLIVSKVKDVDNAEFVLKTTGFTNVEVNDGGLLAIKPKYAIGSAAKLNLKKPQKQAVWKIDDDLDEVETIDPDNLLDDEDLKKPDPASLRVCGTTGKRKACKDCSCGLAEELLNEVKVGKVVDTTDVPKSSCGSCYLGDAFRCATCPYLGMPAFKPGEKIELSDTLLKADI